jgi:NADPH:quinone reductase-like Zn-dependent oxidoreductase
MPASVVTALGGPEGLKMVELPDPVPAPGGAAQRARRTPGAGHHGLFRAFHGARDRGEWRGGRVLVEVDRPALSQLIEAVAEGRLRTRVAATFPLEDAAEAHRLFEAGHLRGKIVLVP